MSKADKVRQVRLCRPGAARTSQLMTTLATRRQHPMEKGYIIACEPAVKGFVAYRFSKQFVEVIVSLEIENIL